MGDTGVGFPVGAIPSYDPLALLSLARHNAGDIENAIEFKNSDANGAEFILRNENGTLLLTSTTGLSGSGFKVDVPNEICMYSYDVYIESTGQKLELVASQNINNSAAGNINISATENIDVESSTGLLKLEATGTNGEIEIKTFGQNSAVLIESAEGSVDLRAESGTVQLQDNQLGELQGDGEEMTFDIVNTVLIKGNVSNTLDSNQKVTLQIGGVDKFFVEQSLNTSTQSIFFENDNTGIMFRDGGGGASGFLPAPNNTAPESDRTLADYLNKTYSGNIMFYKDTSPIGNFDINLQYSGDEDNDQIGINQLTSITNSKNTVSYIKIGDLVNVWGTIYGGSDNNWSGVTDQLVLAIENDALFPYKNGWYDAVNDTYIGQPVLVDVTVGGSTAIDINNWSSSLNLGADADIIGIKGVISTGSSRMHLFWQVWDPTNPLLASSYRNIPCQPDHFAYGGTAGEPLSFTFSFSMPTSRKSYSKTAGQYWITSYYQDPPTLVGGNEYTILSTVLDANNVQRGVKAEVGTLTNAIVESQCSNNNINTVSSWAPIDILVDMESAGGNWAYSSGITTLFYNGTPVDNSIAGGAEYIGTSTLKPIRNINTTGSDITDVITFVNTSYPALQASVELVHPNISMFFDVASQTTTPSNDTLNGDIKVYSNEGWSTMYSTVSRLYGDYQNLASDYYTATGIGSDDITITAEYIRPFATVGHFSVPFMSGSPGYVGTFNVHDTFEIPVDIDLATHNDGSSISLSDFECWKISTSTPGNITIGALNLNGSPASGTTNSNDISDAFHLSESLANPNGYFSQTIYNGVSNGLRLGTYSNCYDGQRDPKIMLEVRGESPVWTTPSTSNLIGSGPSSSMSDAVDGPWANEDKEITTFWQHKQDNSIQKTIKVVLKKDPCRLYHYGNSAINAIPSENTFRNGNYFANGIIELGIKSVGGGQVAYGYSSGSYRKKDLVIFHEETGYQWGLIGYSGNGESWEDWWDDASLGINSWTSNTPNASGTKITLSFNTSIAGWNNGYVDVIYGLIPKYTSGIDAGSFTTASKFGGQGNYVAPSNNPINQSFNSNVYYIGGVPRSHSGGYIDQSGTTTGHITGQTLAGGDRFIQRWGKKIIVRCWMPVASAPSGK